MLDVIAVVSNPIRWNSRKVTAERFIQHMLKSGVRLTIVEAQLGTRAFEFSHPEINHVKVRHATLVWHKENLINLGLASLPDDWRYVAWIDADITFRRADWAEATLNALQQYDIVQPWHDCYDLGPNGEHVKHHRSFCRQFWHGCPIDNRNPKYELAHPGYAWAIRRDALNRLGGLLEIAALGAGDHHMALALIGDALTSLPDGIGPAYRNHVLIWQQRAVRHINRNIGCISGTIEHAWHGSKVARRYIDRWKILIKHKFDPDTDLKRNTWGVLELNDNKPGLRLDIDRYFRQRNEDGNVMD